MILNDVHELIYYWTRFKWFRKLYDFIMNYVNFDIMLFALSLLLKSQAGTSVDALVVQLFNFISGMYISIAILLEEYCDSVILVFVTYTLSCIAYCLNCKFGPRSEEPTDQCQGKVDLAITYYITQDRETVLRSYSEIVLLALCWKGLDTSSKNSFQIIIHT